MNDPISTERRDDLELLAVCIADQAGVIAKPIWADLGDAVAVITGLKGGGNEAISTADRDTWAELAVRVTDLTGAHLIRAIFREFIALIAELRLIIEQAIAAVARGPFDETTVRVTDDTSGLHSGNAR